METLEVIKSRRSIRRFLRKDVSKKLLDIIIESGMRAPSAKNTQPWHFLVLKGKKKDDITKIVEKEYTKRKFIYSKGKRMNSSTLASCNLVREAPILILVFNKAPFTHGERNVIKDISFDSLHAFTVEIESVSAAIQNMLLAIHDLGLGGVWLADFNFARKKICKFLNCKYDLIAGIALGHPAVSIGLRDIPPVDYDTLK